MDRFLGLMRELAQAVAGRMELMLDGNQRLTEDQALAIARELDRLGFTWFEQPIPQSDIAGYARLNAAVDMPITGGEQLTTLEQFRPYLEQRAYRIVQPDVGWCGITEGIKGEQVLLVAIPQHHPLRVAGHDQSRGARAGRGRAGAGPCPHGAEHRLPGPLGRYPALGKWTACRIAW